MFILNYQTKPTILNSQSWTHSLCTYTQQCPKSRTRVRWDQTWEFQQFQFQLLYVYFLFFVHLGMLMGMDMILEVELLKGN